MKASINNKTYSLSKFDNEDELEKAVAKHAEEIFGEKSVYIDVKRQIKGKKNSFISIPDGYVLDFRNSDPTLWVVENELSTHDSFKHIGIQLLKFATQFSEGSFQVKEVLFEAIVKNNLKEKVKKLIKGTDFTNVSEALDFAIYKNDFSFVIVIDEVSEDLSRVTRELAKQPELLEIKKYVAGKDILFVYDVLLKELDEAKSTKVREIRDIDTMVAPAKAGGHKKAFLEQKAWWAVRISSSVIPKLKYLAMYEVAPVSAIQWVGKIQSIKSYEDTGKYKIYLSEIFKIDPIKMKDKSYTPQSPRYTKYELFEGAKTLSDIF